jgi:DNA replication protein DnaC
LSTAEQLNERGHDVACTCTACSLERALQQTPRTEPTAYTSPEQPGVAAAIAELAALRGVELGPIVHRCECGLEVPARGDVCPTCSEAHSLALRRMVLSKAWASLPAWDHADLALGSRCPAHRDLLALVARWTRADGNVLLLGKTGAGKSTSAVAGAKRILRRAEAQVLPVDEMAFAVRLRFVRGRDLVADARNHPLGSRGDPPLFRAAERASLLILDEVGFEPPDVQAGTIARLLERRYDDKSKRTWATSGLTKEQFAERYGAALGRKMGIDEPEQGVVVEVF